MSRTGLILICSFTRLRSLLISVDLQSIRCIEKARDKSRAATTGCDSWNNPSIDLRDPHVSSLGALKAGPPVTAIHFLTVTRCKQRNENL
jgi:hypothetical protein